VLPLHVDDVVKGLQMAVHYNLAVFCGDITGLRSDAAIDHTLLTTKPLRLCVKQVPFLAVSDTGFSRWLNLRVNFFLSQIKHFPLL